MRRAVSDKKMEKLFVEYTKYQKLGLRVSRISLNKYLEVAAICYRAVYSDEVERLTNAEMYQKFANLRWGTLFEIKDWNSEDDFMKWIEEDKQVGYRNSNHAFEIIYAATEIGPCLFPPNYQRVKVCKEKFMLRCYDEQYFISMVRVLMKNKVPFLALGSRPFISL